MAMGTLTPPVATMHHRLYSGSFETSKLANAAQCVSVSNMSLGMGTWNFGTVHHAGRFCVRDSKFRIFSTPRILVNQADEEEKLYTEVDQVRDFASYSFHTVGGGLVKVSVGKRSSNYVVFFEVSSMPLDIRKLSLNWRVSNLPIDYEGFTTGAKSEPKEKTFKQISSGKFSLDLEFKASETPFNLSFLLQDSDNAVIRSHRKTSFCVPVGFTRGSPSPLGLSFTRDGSVNFSLFSKCAESVVLCIHGDSGVDEPALEIGLDPYVNRSGHIWHASLKCDPEYTSYCYRCKTNTSGSGHFVSDPYAKVVRKSGFHLLGQLCKEPFFDWDGDVRPNIPKEKLVVYRLNVKHFTVDKSSQLPHDIAGYFSGLIEKLTHFKNLGVNAVLLEPVSSFHDQEGPYFPCNFFSPSNLYGSFNQSMSAINSMKEMVKAFHAKGIEVLMEVVFSHTAESGALQGIDDSSYYLKEKSLETANSLNCNYPVVQQMIIDSLRYWVTDFHIDGFCFINASSLLKGVHGEILSRPPLVESIAFDPLLSKTKIIADSWNPHDLALEDVRFPHWKKWAEVNSRFCKDIRNFLRGEALLSDLATRLCGSGDKFSDGRGPAFSFNFISRNSGLSLVDLVSFSKDKVLASELSWNCGKEGPTTKTKILETRLKQIRNYLFILFVSLGIPVLNMGDECGQSTGGSISYSKRKPLDWNALKSSYGIQTTQFISFLSSLRIRRSDLLQRREYLEVENIDWHGSDQCSPKWDNPTSKFLAVTLRADVEETEPGSEASSVKGDLFLAFNAADHPENVVLPPPPPSMEWQRLVDTALPFPGFFSLDGEPLLEELHGLLAYEMKSHSCTLFEARSPSE
ncbi:unnamed protein product [Rhodiola kirilowii]